MRGAERLVSLLPSVWRPQPDAGGPDFFDLLMATAGRALDDAGIDAGDILTAHWSGFADSALTSAAVARGRAAAREPVLKPGDAGVAAHPYLDDLPRLAALLGAVPWDEPLAARERVEEFRTRLRRLAALAVRGAGTAEALRRAAEAALPVLDRAAPPGLTERAFALEEAAPLGARRLDAGAALGPLMRWGVDSGSLSPVAPAIYLTALAVEPGRTAPCALPIIERFDPATGTGVGIGYAGTLDPGQTLAILPVARSWLGGAAGLRLAEAEDDPTAAGPWAPVPGGPPGPVAAVARTADGSLWAATGPALWRLDGAGWAEVAAGLPTVHALLAEGATLWIGHDGGLSSLSVADAAPAPVEVAGGAAVLALSRLDDGPLWVATAAGAATLGAGGLEPAGAVMPLAAVLAEPDGTLFVGGAAGLFRHVPATGTWHHYRGRTAEERVPDWAPFDPADPVPDPALGGLPPVTALHRGPDRTLWIGTERGLAAYRARETGGTYTTLLTAFPALGTGRVAALGTDDRGRLWAGAALGLMVHDGADWWQARAGALARLPRSADPRGAGIHWRFDRGPGDGVADGTWSRALPGDPRGFLPQAPEPDADGAEAAVTAIAWTDAAVARLGVMAGAAFVPDPAALPAALETRWKPQATETRAGGPPAVPRVMPGTGWWRYLAREEADPPVPRAFPAWTREGRLLPPPDAGPAPWEGRFLAEALAPGDQVFAYDPQAAVTMVWHPRAPLSLILRLVPATADEVLPAVVVDRLAAALDQGRPAGSRIGIALGNVLLRGGDDG